MPRRELPSLLLVLLVTAAMVPVFTQDVRSSSGLPPNVKVLTNASYNSCFMDTPHTGNPVFGDLASWNGGTAWTDCTSLSVNGGGLHIPDSIGYSIVNSSTGLLLETTITNVTGGIPTGNRAFCMLLVSEQLGLSSANYCDTFWYYRGEIVVPYRTPGSLYVIGNSTYGLFGYDTAGFNTATGHQYTIDVPVSGSMNFACKMLDTTTCINTIDVSATHPTLSGSSANVGLAYNLRVPALNLTYNGNLITSFSSQWTTDVEKFSAGSWQEYVPASGPPPSVYTVQTLQDPCVPGSPSYSALEQSAETSDVISGGYTGFAYLVTTMGFVPQNCNVPLQYPIMDSLVVADLNAGGAAHAIATFYPQATGSTPSTATTCEEQPPCFGNFNGMWGNLLMYRTFDPTNNNSTYWLADALHGTQLRVTLPVQITSGRTISDKLTDGSSMLWFGPNTQRLNLWNGHLGILERLANYSVADAPTSPKVWADGRWAAWTNKTGDFTFYDSYNNTVAYLNSPHLWSVNSSGTYSGYYLLGLNDFQNGLATWVTSSVTNGVTGDYRLHWYNVTAASLGHPVSGQVDMPWIKDIGELVSSGGWVYLSALAVGGTSAQIYAIQLPSVLKASSSSGGTIQYQLSGNVSAAQVLKSSFVPDASGNLGTLSLSVTGQSGTSGEMTVSVPKASVSSGLVPVVLVNGVQALPQSFTQDSLNFVITFTVHFSTDAVDINFVQPTGPTSTTGSATASSSSTQGTQTATTSSASGGGGGGIPEFPYQLVVASAFTVLLVASYLLVRR
ncbi:MAG: hypothetical protein OK404_02035, partial [Thaumarchaeota archaeon]|nr:hypothetical protein [Nitrososphaerota archaeon]